MKTERLKRSPRHVWHTKFSMKFQQTRLNGVFEIHIEPNYDERGFFARVWCQEEFERHNLNPKLVQCSVSSNAKKGTLRGVHYQAAPYPETKVVRSEEHTSE